MPKYWFKDFVTGKMRWTAGEFESWTQPTGLLKVPYAIFRRKSGVLLIPKYLLTPETLAMLPKLEGKG